MKSFIKKIWLDVTTNTCTGEYSVKRLQIVMASFFSVLITLPYVFELHIYPVLSFNLKEPPVEVLVIWILMALGQSGLLIMGKYFGQKNAFSPSNPTPQSELKDE